VRLGEVLARERAFSADVAHQLRTGLTGLQLGLESALTRPGADLTTTTKTALARSERLRTVIEDLVRLARDTSAPGVPLDLPALMEEVRQDWHPRLAERGRRLSITIEPDLPQVTASLAAVRQVLLVLVGNALVHGGGEVAILVADVGPAVAIEVGDQGPGIAEGVDVFLRSSPPSRDPGSRHGIGLALARSLTEAEGGRLILRRQRPPLFSVLLPGSQP